LHVSHILASDLANKFKAKAINTIMTALKGNGTLVRLNLDDTFDDFESDGAAGKCILDALYFNKTLTELNVSKNYIEQATFVEILRVVRHNRDFPTTEMRSRFSFRIKISHNDIHFRFS
jgi:hypothetical protein